MSTTISANANATTGAAARGTAAQAAGTAAAPRIGADFNTVLTLLTTQLRNQDPTKAMDVQQMTQQLVQFAGVEQQLAVNQNLERMIGLQQGSQLLSAAPLIGREVEVESERLALQAGQATLRLQASPTGPREARVEVLDGTGRAMRSSTVTLGSEPRSWRWDGRDNGGRQLADGSYAVRVTTTDGAAVGFTVIGRTTAAERAGGEVQLRLGALAVPFEKMRGLTEAR
ncbi:MAG: flagellar hook assembly protein FlgD [Rubritepida sp.]|nr:flagellar hook assembly protein FlgD [Rubritepida sp.]